MSLDKKQKQIGDRRDRLSTMASGLGKIPPQALDLEESVLGAIMMERDAVLLVSGMLSPEAFYKASHQKIFEAIQALFFKNVPVDILTVTAKLREQGDLEMIGGAYYITELTARVASAANVEHHARIIQQKHIARELIRISTEVISNAYEETVDIFDLADHQQTSLFNLLSAHLGGGITTISDSLINALDILQKPAVEGLTGIGSGINAIDRVTAGWQKQDFIIVAARPAMGKTAFMMTLARNAAVTYKKPVAVFSLEMSTLQLTNRLISAESEVHMEKIQRRTVDEWEWQQINSKLTDLANSQIFIDDTPALFMNALRAKCIRLKQTEDIQMILIDYLQLLNASIEKGGNREQVIAAISRGCKAIAKELDVPVIGLSQLSRAVESRPGGAKRPMLSDLRESGAIEQDADVVIFLYRPEYYGLTEDEQGRSTQGIGEVIIAKHRNGKTETVPLRFNGAKMKWSDLEDDYGYEAPGPNPFTSVESHDPAEFQVPNNFIIRPSRMDDIDDEPPF